MPEERICPIVEGHGDVLAVPIVLRRIARDIDPTSLLNVVRPIRIPKEKLLRPGELERAARLAAHYLPDGGTVLVLLDCERPGCPATEGPQLLGRMKTATPKDECTVVLAHQEFETWFLAAARSLAGHRGLPTNLDPPDDPVAIRGAKEWLARRMLGNRTYSETLDQAAFAATMSIDEARRSDSFDRLWRVIRRLLHR